MTCEIHHYPSRIFPLGPFPAESETTAIMREERQQGAGSGAFIAVLNDGKPGIFLWSPWLVSRAEAWS